MCQYKARATELKLILLSASLVAFQLHLLPCFQGKAKVRWIENLYSMPLHQMFEYIFPLQPLPISQYEIAASQSKMLPAVDKFVDAASCNAARESDQMVRNPTQETPSCLTRSSCVDPNRSIMKATKRAHFRSP